MFLVILGVILLTLGLIYVLMKLLQISIILVATFAILMSLGIVSICGISTIVFYMLFNLLFGDANLQYHLAFAFMLGLTISFSIATRVVEEVKVIYKKVTGG